MCVYVCVCVYINVTSFLKTIKIISQTCGCIIPEIVKNTTSPAKKTTFGLVIDSRNALTMVPTITIIIITAYSADMNAATAS